jgi:transcriptional regulator with XRE-family HTH domain
MAMDVKKQFGRRLAQLRKERGMSQEALSLESGVARSYLGGVERGQRNIALVNICKLAETLDVEAGSLFDFSKLPDDSTKRPSKKTKQKETRR